MKKFLTIFPRLLFIVLLISPFLFPSHAFAVSGGGTGTLCMASRYWVGGTGTWDASDTTHWAVTSGGAGGQPPPVGLGAVFDASSGGGTVTLGYSPSLCAITMGAFTGTLDAATFSPTMDMAFSGTGTGTRTLNMGSGTWTVSGDGFSASNAWDITTATNLTLNAQTSTVKLTSTSAATANAFQGGSQIYNNVWFARGTNIGKNAVSGSNTFNDFKDDGSAAHNLVFFGGSTQTFSTFSVSGTAGNVIVISSGAYNMTTNEIHALVKTGGGMISSDYLNIQHSVATPASTWYAGTHSTNNQAVSTAGSGWIFTDVPAGGAASPPRVMRLFSGFKIQFKSGILRIQ